jgi:hypothetical protein
MRFWIAIGLVTLTCALWIKTIQAAESATNTTVLSSPGKGVPRIQFETNFIDLGKITAAEKISGVFKFRNAGDGVLKVGPPIASCDCTDAQVKPDTLGPGESGEILYTIKLDRPLNGQRFIRVRSNDPKTPETELTMQLDYTPLYRLVPMMLRLTLPAGRDETQGSFTVSRTDGKPLQIDRLMASKEWISAAFDPSFKREDNSGRVNVTVRRPVGPPAAFEATIQMWSSNQTTGPVQSLPVTGEIMGELAAVPARLYWVIPDFGTNKASYPAEALMKKIELISVLGHEVELRNATSNVKGMSVQIMPKEGKTRFEMIVRFDELPEEFTNATVTVETSLASLPKLQVPMTIAVAR